MLPKLNYIEHMNGRYYKGKEQRAQMKATTTQIQQFADFAVNMDWSPVSLTKTGRLSSQYHYGQLNSIGQRMRPSLPAGRSQTQFAEDFLDNNRPAINKSIKALLVEKKESKADQANYPRAAEKVLSRIEEIDKLMKAVEKRVNRARVGWRGADWDDVRELDHIHESLKEAVNFKS